MDKETIIDRVRKLLALAESPNENEAMAAAEKAQALLAQYNIEMSEVQQGGSDYDFRYVGKYTNSEPWRRVIACNLAPLYFCEYYWSYNKVETTSRRCGYKRYDNHTFVGRQHNLEVIVAMFDYLIKAVERMEGEAWVEVKARKQSLSRSSFYRSFVNACAARLANRLALRRLDIMGEPQGLSHEKNTLPALYNDELSRINEFIGPGLKTKDLAMSYNNYEGMRAGHNAADSIGLDTQLTARSNAHLLGN